MYSVNNHLNYQLKIWLSILLVLIMLIILVGGLTRLTDSGLSITTWELFVGLMPPISNDKWIEYFKLYKQIPEFSEQNFNMTLDEFKIIFWWEWVHRQLGRLIGLTVLLPLIYFTFKNGAWICKKYGIIFILVCFQGFIGWYMVASGLVERVDVSHYRLSLHLVTAFIILSIVFWKFLQLTDLKNNKISIKINSIKFFLLLLFLQLIVGAFVSGMDAGKIYNTWPLMGDHYFPDDNKFINLFKLSAFSDPSLVQYLHRNLAYLILIIFTVISYITYRNKIFYLFKPVIILGLIILLQIVLGILTVLSGASILTASLHQFSSILLITSSLYFLHKNRFS